LSRRLKTFYFQCFDFAVFKSVAALFLDHSPSADFGNSVGGQKNNQGGFHPNGYVLFLIPFLSLTYQMLAVSVPDISSNRSSLVPRLFVILSREGNTFTEIFFGFCSIFQIFNTEVIKMAARMRTIRDALKTIKELDPDSAVTYNFIKQLCETDKITNVRLNKKYLLNLDELLKFLNMED
jgi:hypothetical protein